jgi:16S rRNA (uracil1498-N3)-methyltransferase
MRRFFIAPTDIDGKIIRIGGGQYNHISNVLRLKTGDGVVACLGDGYDLICEIIAIDKAAATLKILEKQKNICEPTHSVTLFQAVLKGEKMDLVIQKAVELGVFEVVPFESKNTVAKNSDAKNIRLNRISLEAAKQCGRAVAPDIKAAASLDGVLKMLKNYDRIIFPYELERAQGLSPAYISKLALTGRVALIIGSEGGFSADEAQKLIEAGAKSVSLGNRILRAETAAICALSIVMYALGEIGGV